MVNFAIAGIDISRNKATVCILAEIPPDLNRFKQTWKRMDFRLDVEGLNNLLALDFHGAILEPTGGHYSKLWAYRLAEAGKAVRWVGNQEISAYRESWKVFNKSDALDAIALACYGLERWSRPQFFIDPSQLELREIYYQLQHLNRIKNPIQNRVRQQLSHELPEWSERDVKRIGANPPGLWLAIAGESSRPKYESEQQASIGLGLSDFTRGLGRLLCEIERQEYEIEQRIEVILRNPNFKPYMEVFERYAISDRTALCLLTVVYPIRQFLQDGREMVDHISTANGKRSRRNRSKAKFKLACGLGMVWYQSGNTSKWVPGGRADVRIALWRWCKISVVMQPNLELPAIARLRAYYEKGSKQVVNGQEKTLDPGVRNQRVMRVVRRMLDSLYKDLLSIG
jgi:hypothetical protein